MCDDTIRFYRKRYGPRGFRFVADVVKGVLRVMVLIRLKRHAVPTVFLLPSIAVITNVIHREGRGRALQDLLVRYGRVQLHIVGAIILGFFVLGNRFVACWMGSDYEPVYWSALLLILPSLVNLPQMAADVALTASGEVRQQCVAYVIMALVNIILMVPLSSLFGAVGAGLAVMFAYLVRTVCLNVVYKRYLNISPLSFYSETFSSWLIPACSVSTFFVIFDRSLPLEGWLPFAALVFMFSILYVVAAWRFSMNSFEKDLFSSVVRKAVGRDAR